MAFLLNIDTATDVASVCISQNDSSIGLLENHEQKEHASFVHTSIQQLVEKTGIPLHKIDAIAVTSGPGSYTGLRVGLSTAKGLCYALNKPLITIGTLNVMTIAAQQFASNQRLNVNLFCPMIDARRMEVFTVIHDEQLNELMPARSLILDENSFDNWLQKDKILFLGTGSSKFEAILNSKNAFFEVIPFNASHLATLSWLAFCEKRFADVAYSEPEYLKDFYTPISVRKY